MTERIDIMKIIDRDMLENLTEAARVNPRGRQNLNLHASYADPCQRLLNAVEPGSYIRPHRHLTPPKPETFLALRGRLAVAVFQDYGEIEQAVLLDAAAGPQGVDLPAGAWHAILALDPGAVFFEAKPGPYEPIPASDQATWAPPEGSAEAVGYLEDLQKRILTILKENSVS